MTRGKEQRWKYATIAMYTAVGVGLLACPAAAGSKEFKNWKSTSTTETVDAADDEYYEDAGTSNPTNVPIVMSDLDAMAMVMPPEEQMQAPPVWGKVTGRGIVVAVLDGGFNLSHPAIAGNLAPAAYDAIGATALDAQPVKSTLTASDDYVLVPTEDVALVDERLFYVYDDVTDLGNGYDDDGDGLIDETVGHGTFVAGMVLRIAPEATILPIRVRDDEGYGLDEWLCRGVLYAIDQRVDVINMSIEAGDAWSPGLADILNKAAASGISIVISAGNSGNGGKARVNDIAWTVRSLLVGSVDQSDGIAEFSSYEDLQPGKRPAMMTFAPGVDLCGPVGVPNDDSFACWSGTSFSAPLVSGAVALMRQLHPELEPMSIAELLWHSKDPVYDGRGRALVNSGRVNVWRAVTE